MVALPSAIAYGVLVYSALGAAYAGAGAVAGILGAAVLGIVAPLVGRNGGFISAPCAPAAAVLAGTAASLMALPAMSAERAIALLSAAVLLAAVLQAILGLLRVGQMIKFIPYQIVSGYLSGVALVIAVGQLPKLLGLPKSVSLAAGLVSPQLWNWTGISVGLVTMAAMVMAPRLTSKVPAAIIALLGGIAAYFALAMFNHDLLTLDHNALVIGRIAAAGALPALLAERFDLVTLLRPTDVALVLGPALTLAVLLSIDTLKTGVVLDTLTHRRHNSDRELLAQGAANFVNALVGGMPGAGTMGPTLVNIASGGRSLWSGACEGVLVLVVFVLLGSLISWVPISALAGLLLMVAWRMFDRSIFALVKTRGTRIDFAVIATVIVVAQFDLILASTVGIAIAILLFIRDQIRSPVIERIVHLSTVQSRRKRLMAERELLVRDGRLAAIVELRGNLFFGTTDQLFSRIEPELDSLRYLLIDLRRVHSMDYTGAHLLAQMRDRLMAHGGELLFCGMPSQLPSKQDIEDYLSELGLVHGAGVQVFATRDSAIEWMENQLLDAAGWQPADEEVLLELGNIELFEDLDADSLTALATAAVSCHVAAGEPVFRHDDAGDELWLIRRGRVHVLLPLPGGKVHHVATLCQGDYFGELAFLDQEPRSADVIAAVPTELYRLSRRRFDEVALQHPALGSRVFERLAHAVSRRLRATDVELQALEAR